MKTFIVALLKHFKSFNNLLLNLSIKSVLSFSYIKLVMKYYSYFRYILEYFKGNRFYNIFKAFFKVIALINILLGLFTLIVFTDFRYEEYKQFIHDFYFTDFTFTGLFCKFKKSIKRVLNYLISLFDDSIAIDTPKSDKTHDNSNIPNKDLNTKSYTGYYCLIGFVTIVLCFKYPEYTVTPIISGITSFVWGLLGGEDDDSSDKTTDINHLDKGKGRDITKSDIDHLTTLPTESVPKPSGSTISRTSSSSSSKIFFDKYFPILNTSFSDKTVSSIGVDNDLSNDNEWSKSDSLSDSSSSSSSGSDTVTPGSTVTPIDTTGSSSGNSSSPNRRKPFSPKWGPPKGGWK